MNGCKTLRSWLRSRLHRFTVPQRTKWQRVGNQIDAAMIFAGPDFVNVCSAVHSFDDFPSCVGPLPLKLSWHAQTNRCESECHRACAYTTCFVEMAYASTRRVKLRLRCIEKISTCKMLLISH